MSDLAHGEDAVAQPGARRPDDTAELRASILAGIVHEFALDPSPKRGVDVFCAAVRRAGGDADLSGLTVRSAMTLLVRGGILTCNTIEPMTGSAEFTSETVLCGGRLLAFYRTFVLPEAEARLQVN